jgi:hypothetical protein
MNYSIAIPSYKRAVQLQNKTLTCLNNNNIPKELINIFVIEEEYEEYLEKLNKNYYNKIIIGKLGLVPQKEFIQEYYPIGTRLIFLDDDVENVDLSLTEYKSLNEFFEDAFTTCEEVGIYLWSVYPVENKFFREKRPSKTIGLNFCIGAFYGIINRRDDDLNLELTRTSGNKEDVERSILYYLKDGKTLRYNRIGFKTKYYGVGGLGGLAERRDMMKADAILINKKYPAITRVKIRKNGLYEIVFVNKKEKATLPSVEATLPSVEDKGVLELPKIEPSEDNLLEVYNLLDSITLPVLTNKMGRAKTFGRHRAITMGLIRGRVTKKYELSRHSLKYPLLYEALMKFGKTIVPFEFNAIHVNHNLVCPRHLDASNTGNSLLVSFGDYEGCNIVVEGHGEYNTNCSPIVFNGATCYHYNTPLKSGNKYSLVFFTNYA